MAQHNNVEIPVARHARADYTALRAYLNRIPLERIADLYYGEDDRERLGLRNTADLRHRLDDLRDELVHRASDANPALSEALQRARQSARWSKAAIDYLVQAADRQDSAPRHADPVSMWLRPRIAALLKGEGARTVGELIGLINGRGHGWWRPIPRIGQGKAAAIVAWLRRHATGAGSIDESALAPPLLASPTDIVVLAPERPVLVPFERIGLPEALSGTHGINRNASFCLIYARNDLEAIEAYLYKFRAQEKTRRAYRKELERFLLWCIHVRRKALSSTLLEDCEAYKDFIADPPPEWIGAKAARLGPRWKPFAGKPSAQSQRYAVQTVRTFFAWLVDVRYLGGNPWAAVGDPPVARTLHPLQIEKALPADLWAKLIEHFDALCAESDAQLRQRYRLRGASTGISLSAQFRLARAALHLLGDAGLRREEVAGAMRNRLRPLRDTPELWELDVLGKRNKWRTTFLPMRAVEALRAHWTDRALDFSFGMQETPLLAPLIVPRIAPAMQRHGTQRRNGFTPDGIYQVLTRALIRIGEDPTLDFDPWERALLLDAGPHAFRHTFGTTAAAAGVPVDVLQRVFGHASLQTTTVYIQAEKRRSVEELGKFFGKKNPEERG